MGRMPLLTLMLAGDRPLDVDPATLAMRLRNPDVEVSSPGPERKAHPVEGLAASSTHAAWTWSDQAIAADLQVEGGRLRVRLSCPSMNHVWWPTARPSGKVLVPFGEGLRVDLDQPFWRKALDGVYFDVGEGLTMPFVGFEVPGGTLTYMWEDLPRTLFEFRDLAGVLTVRGRRDWTLRAGPEPTTYEVWVAPGPAGPLAPALAFRQLQQELGHWTSLASKIAAQPAVGKLPGAIHAYMWGDGRTTKALDALKVLGIDRAWLGFDGELHDQGFVKAAVARGYLAGPYDTYDNVQDPAKADTSTSVFDKSLFENGGILLDSGRTRPGFGGRGWQLSSEALRLAKPDWIGRRIAGYQALGANSVFLDTDADGQLFEDHHPQHRMTPWQDRENRLARLRRVAAAGLVVGSETGTSWATPVLAFAHGAATVTYGPFWKLLNTLGGWTPERRPGLFFSPVGVSEDQRRLMFDPATRVPLYQAVYHDSLVSTERWELSPVKLKGLSRLRTLQEMLYGVPSLWNLDLQALEDNGPRLRDINRFFGPLHRAIATLPLTRFEVLSPDRMVQRTRFGDEVELTANFGSKPFGKHPPMSITAKWLETGQVGGFQPSPWWDE
jgi:hypothetical protein